MANSKLSVSNPPISIKSTPINLSDDTLKIMLIQSYESAQINECKFNLLKFAGMLLSVAGTLLISLLTSSFQSIGQLSADIVTLIAILLCVFCGLTGLILLSIRCAKRIKVSTEERDAAIQEIIQRYMEQRVEKNG